MDIISNRDTVTRVVNHPKKKFKGPDGYRLAATCIQKYYRRHRAYGNYKQLKFLIAMATVIQRKYRLWQIKHKTRKKIKKINADSYKVWLKMQEEFRKNWGTIKTEKRVEIHINSFSLSEMQRLSTEKFKQKENSQMSRIFRVKDPLLDIIYISPYPLTKEITDYYQKIMELVEIENPESRFTIVVPENYVKFPRHFSLT